MTLGTLLFVLIAYFTFVAGYKTMQELARLWDKSASLSPDEVVMHMLEYDPFVCLLINIVIVILQLSCFPQSLRPVGS